MAALEDALRDAVLGELSPVDVNVGDVLELLFGGDTRAMAEALIEERGGDPADRRQLRNAMRNVQRWTTSAGETRTPKKLRPFLRAAANRRAIGDFGRRIRTNGASIDFKGNLRISKSIRRDVPIEGDFRPLDLDRFLDALEQHGPHEQWEPIAEAFTEDLITAWADDDGRLANLTTIEDIGELTITPRGD